MITKAYIVSQSATSSNKYIVRIPLLNSAEGDKQSTPNEELSEATLSTLPATTNVLHQGDCVFVGFEDNDLSRPVIVGHLFTETLNNTPIDLSLRKLQIEDTKVSEARLPTNTTIGKVSAKNIKCLEGCTLNIRDTFYNMRYYFSESSTQDPAALFKGTTWELVSSTPTDFGAYVWHRIDRGTE